MKQTDSKIAELLKSILSTDQIELAVQRAEQQGTSLIRQLEDLGFLCESEVASLLAHASQLPLLPTFVPNELKTSVSGKLCADFLCVPVEEDEDTFVMAITNPMLIEEVELHLSRPAKWVVAPESAIKLRLFQLFGVPMFTKGTYDDILKHPFSENEDPNRRRANRLVHAMLVDAIEAAADLHIMQDSNRWRACLCCNDDVHELFTMDSKTYLQVASYLKSFLKPQDAESGEFMLRVSPLEFVRFFLDIDRDHTAEQLFLAIVDHHILDENSRVSVVLEVPVDLYNDFQSVSQATGVSVGEMIDHAWSLARDTLSIPCVCPFAEKTTESVEMRVSLSPMTADEMGIAAVQNDRTIQWAILKVLLMSRDCVLRMASQPAET